MFSSVMKQETAFFDKSRSGELVSRLATDTTVIRFIFFDKFIDL